MMGYVHYYVITITIKRLASHCHDQDLRSGSPDPKASFELNSKFHLLAVCYTQLNCGTALTRSLLATGYGRLVFHMWRLHLVMVCTTSNPGLSFEHPWPLTIFLHRLFRVRWSCFFCHVYRLQPGRSSPKTVVLIFGNHSSQNIASFVSSSPSAQQSSSIAVSRANTEQCMLVFA